jgi:hypothetical protein
MDRNHREVSHLTYERKDDLDSDKWWSLKIALGVLRIAQGYYIAIGKPFPMAAAAYLGRSPQPAPQPTPPISPTSMVSRPTQPGVVTMTNNHYLIRKP